jgi:hypothetical protein
MDNLQEEKRIPQGEATWGMANGECGMGGEKAKSEERNAKRGTMKRKGAKVAKWQGLSMD